MVAWLSWLFDARIGADHPSSDPKDQLRALKVQRRQLINQLCSLRTYGFDTLAGDDEAALKALEKRILALQLSFSLPVEPEDLPLP